MNKLMLSKYIYTFPAIENAISAFSELATISIREETNCYLFEFENCVYEEDITLKEFENYLIDLSNKLGY